MVLVVALKILNSYMVLQTFIISIGVYFALKQPWPVPRLYWLEDKQAENYN